MAEHSTAPVDLRPRALRARQHVLVGIDDTLVGMVFEISPPVVLGRERGVELMLAHEGISRRHAEIIADEAGRLRLRDLGSTNGTHLNGEKVDERALGSGDIIGIGNLELEFRLVTDVELRAIRNAAHARLALTRLSHRELEIAHLVAEGLRSAEIAERLFISTRTVIAHLEHIYQRLETKNRPELVRLVSQASMLDRD